MKKILRKDGQLILSNIGGKGCPFLFRIRGIPLEGNHVINKALKLGDENSVIKHGEQGMTLGVERIIYLIKKALLQC